MSGKLSIESWNSELGVIEVQPSLDLTLLKEEFALSFYIYKEDNDDYDFKFYLEYIKIPKRFKDNFFLNTKFKLNKNTIGYNNIWYYGEEFLVTELSLRFSSTSKKNILIGKGKAKNKNQEISFDFKGKYKLNKLNIWSFDGKANKKEEIKIV